MSLRTYKRAKEIFGDDFITPEKIAITRGIRYTCKNLEKCDDAFPTDEELIFCRDNAMLLLAGPPVPLSLLDIRAITSGSFRMNSGNRYEGKSEKFAQCDKATPGWLALRKYPVVDSRNLTWSSQRMRIVPPMYTPNAAEVAWCLTTYKEVRGHYLLSDCSVRTASIDSEGAHVEIGHFDSSGLDVTHCWGDYMSTEVGIAAARKFGK